MFPRSLLLCFLLSFLCSLAPSHGWENPSVMYMEVTHPLPTDYQHSTCSLTVFKLAFNATAGSSAVSGNYTAPANCTAPWSAVVAELSFSVIGDQDKRIAALWVGGVEFLRSSTVQTVGHGAVWKVRKDVTKYSSVLSSSNSTAVSVIFKDVIKDSVAAETLHSNVSGTFHVNVTLLFYGGTIQSARYGGGENRSRSRKLGLLDANLETSRDESRESGLLRIESEESEGKLDKTRILDIEREKRVEIGENLRLPSEGRGEFGLKSSQFYRTPADLIIPISASDTNGTGFWFEIQNASDAQSKEIKIPSNTYQAVLEIYASAHGDEEFWYANPPTRLNVHPQKESENLTIAPVKGTFRQVFASIDSLYAGSFVPFPIVYSGGINPAYWDPVVAIGAFDFPSYELVLTPFLGILLDGNNHSITVGVSDSTSFWLVNANLHVWVDKKSPHVTAKLTKYKAPDAEISRKYKFGENSQFKINVEREVEFIGWVNSSHGNLTTRIKQEQEFKNQIEIKSNGKLKKVEQKSETETDIKVEAYGQLVLAKASFEGEYPLELKSETKKKENKILISTKFSHERNEKSSVVTPAGSFYSRLKNKQESESETFVQGVEILKTEANTEQKYKYKGDRGCYIRNLVAGQGLLLEDSFSNICLQGEE